MGQTYYVARKTKSKWDIVGVLMLDAPQCTAVAKAVLWHHQPDRTLSLLSECVRTQKNVNALPANLPIIHGTLRDYYAVRIAAAHPDSRQAFVDAAAAEGFVF